MKFILREPALSVEPTDRIQPLPHRRIGHYQPHDATIPFSGFRSPPMGGISNKLLTSVLMDSVGKWRDKKEQDAKNAADDAAQRIRNEPMEAKWADMRGDIADANDRLRALDALGIENPQALIGEEQYAQPIGPEPRKTLGQLWESDPRYQRFQEWKQQRPTHPGYDKQFFEKGNRNFDLYQGS